MGSSSDRRHFPRITTALQVQYRLAPTDPPDVDCATNLSQGGLFIKTAKRVALGETVEVVFAPHQDARIVQAYCRVTRIAPEGIGAEFLQMDADSAQLLSAAVD